MIYLAIRDGKNIGTIPDPVIKGKENEVWVNGTPMIDSQSKEFIAIGREKILSFIKNKEFDKIPKEAIAKLGVNPSGLEVISQKDHFATMEKNISPAQKERREISALYMKANRLANSDDEDNVSGPMRLRSKANAMYDDWKKKYPEEAKKEQKEKLMMQVDELLTKASGALTYDADGSLSQEDMQRRHDEYIKQAQKIKYQAMSL